MKTSVARQKSLYFDCHSGLEPESSLFDLDSSFRGNDTFGIYVKQRWTQYTGTIFLLCPIILLFLLSGCATTKPEVQTETQAAYIEEVKKEIPDGDGPKEIEEPNLEDKWGIKVLSIRQSAGGYILDFRYRIIDPDKASLLMSRKEKPYLIDQASGARFMVPSSPKVGPLRQTVRSGKPEANRNYFILFTNPGKYVKPGNKVTVVIGEFRAENLVVE